MIRLKHDPLTRMVREAIVECRRSPAKTHTEGVLISAINALTEELAVTQRRREAAADVQKAARVMAAIADAYDENGLDDAARKHWGPNDEHHNTTPPEQIELYAGRGGKTLLTLADCLAARRACWEQAGGVAADTDDGKNPWAPTSLPVGTHVRVRFDDGSHEYTTTTSLPRQRDDGTWMVRVKNVGVAIMLTRIRAWDLDAPIPSDTKERP